MLEGTQNSTQMGRVIISVATKHSMVTKDSSRGTSRDTYSSSQGSRAISSRTRATNSSKASCNRATSNRATLRLTNSISLVTSNMVIHSRSISNRDLKIFSKEGMVNSLVLMGILSKITRVG